VTASGTYQISNSSSGTPVLGSGTVSLSLSGLTVIHIYTTPGTGVETVPTGTTTVQAEVWGAGGSGSSSNGTFGLGSGGSGALAYSSYAASTLGGAGRTFNYTVPSGGAGVTNTSGINGSPGSITAGTVSGFTTMTAGGGHGGGGGSGGAGGTATGGNISNTSGGVGDITGLSGNIPGDGAPYGGGSINTTHSIPSSAGSNGAAVFFYS
jgi:hypothetical protein